MQGGVSITQADFLPPPLLELFPFPRQTKGDIHLKKKKSDLSADFNTLSFSWSHFQDSSHLVWPLSTSASETFDACDRNTTHTVTKTAMRWIYTSESTRALLTAESKLNEQIGRFQTGMSLKKYVFYKSSQIRHFKAHGCFSFTYKQGFETMLRAV